MTAGTSATVDADRDADRDAPDRKRRRMEWARLLRQVFAVDILRCYCGGERKVIAALTRAQSPDAGRSAADLPGPRSTADRTSARCPRTTTTSFGAIATTSNSRTSIPAFERRFAMKRADTSCPKYATRRPCDSCASAIRSKRGTAGRSRSRARPDRPTDRAVPVGTATE